MSRSHDSAHLHVAGKSEFVDDRPELANEVFIEILYATRAHARIKKLDFKAARAIRGVVGIYTADDLHENLWGTIFKDQPLLAKDEVRFYGESLAIIAAETRDIARMARDAARVEYENLPAILSIDDAIEQKSFIAGERKIERGEIGTLSKCKHRLKGRVVIRGADHFYLESQVAVAYPIEGGQIEVHSSSQHPTETQHVVSHALGLQQNQVVCIVKRMGGAFGGKESQAAPYAAYAALAACKLNRPARVVLTKDDDMIVTGKRNPFQNEYEVGFDDEGRIIALDVRLYSDGGAYADLSTSIMERAMLHIDNAYFIPNLRVTGQVCRTNYHPHTAFRGFGGPKGVAVIEYVIEEIAHALGKDALDIRRMNCYAVDGEKSVTHYGQKIENNLLPQLLSDVEKESNYRARRKEIDAHNRAALAGKGPKTLRGLSVTAVKFGISFTTRFLNQANALVIIHRDGTLQVSTGATEMGQGVNARIAQLVANELGLDRPKVRMMPTTTDKNGNTSPTAASSGTDLNGAAAVLATRKLKRRLSELALKLLDIPEAKWARHSAGLGTEKEVTVDEDFTSKEVNEEMDSQTLVASYHGIVFEKGDVFHAKNPKHKLSFAALVNEAYHNRISLTDYAHYRFPNLSFNKLTGEGRAFLYFTQGACASEVELDLEAGETKVQRVDLLMDLGRPINEDLDLGQVSGGFVQGMGWVTTEKLFYNKDGLLVSHSPSTYKIPNVQDTPRTFNYRLVNNTGNSATVRGTKAAGEPPLLLALSVWTAVHDALKSLPAFESQYPRLEIPATQEQVLRAMYSKRFAELEA